MIFTKFLSRASLALTLMILPFIELAAFECLEGNCENGRGKAALTVTHPDLESSEYDGEWRNGKYHGEGKYTWWLVDGRNQEYKGGWQDGEMHGRGRIWFANETRREGWWDEGKYLGKNVCWKGDCSDGKGVYLSYFLGKYEGEFKNGRKHGFGTHIQINNWKYVGEWKDDCFNGQGSYTDNLGGKYDGEWLNCKKHGRGELVHPDDRVESGVWENDLLVLTQVEIELETQGVEYRKSECTSYGFQPGTDGHSNCVMKIALSEKNRIKDKRIEEAAALEKAESDARWAAYRERSLAPAKRQRAAALAALDAEANAAFDAAAKESRKQRQAQALIGLGSAISSGGMPSRSSTPPPTAPVSSGRYKTCSYRVAGEIVPMTVSRAETCSATKLIGGQTGYLVR